jgi:LmbE family N-acetylglucosaminyl deacetylase
MITTSTYTKTVLFIFTFSYFLICSFASAQAPKSYTSSEILLQFKKLNTVGSVLYIAAHPDDENTRLIAYLANEKCLRTGYLSLTRGDGGQNLIGPEQGIELGVIRTQELLAARRIDGGEQFFTRAYDFGYSKSPEETFTKWNKDSILGDMVWVIRNFRPDIIITRFATDGTGGHGHHTASAILAEEAFDAAADPTRFPEQLQYVTVWKTRRLFQNSTARFFNPNADLSHLIKLDVGGYNPLLGKSYGEIAAESRSMHKSQGFGSAKQRGEIFEYFKPIKGDTAGLKDIFEGIDFTWKRVKGGEKIGVKIESLIKEFKIENPEVSLPLIVDLNTKFGSTSFELWQKEMIQNISISLSGMYKEITVDKPAFSRNESFKIVSNKLIRNRDSNETVIRDTINHRINGITQLYWLINPMKDNLFNIYDKGYLISNNIQPNSYVYKAQINSKLKLQLLEPIQYKWTDPEKGELYRPLVITPPVMINVVNDVITFTDNSKKVKVILKAGKDSVEGSLKVSSLTKSWGIVIGNAVKADNRATSSIVFPEQIVPFKLSKKNEEQILEFEIEPYSNAKDEKLTFIANVNGVEYTKGIKEIKYDHIPVQTLFPEAEVKLVKLDVVKKSKRIGYIPGAGDEVQACLSQLGYEVVTLTDEMLSKENLSQFDAIITGVRAYNTNDKLPSFKQKLMDYVASGGNLIVQYNTNSWAGPLASDIGPYKFKITRDRITNEDAKVNLLLPNHPVFNTPNKITDKDFEGWIQERSIYHAGDWDSNYVAPIGMADPNEKENKGALLIGKHGKGNFIYTGLVFFRELPAGVPGAYRLMVNLIELGK